MLIHNSAKEYEKPETGVYDAVVADCVDLGLVTDQFGTKLKIRVIYLTQQLDSKGEPFQLMQQCTQSTFEKAKFYTICKGIMGKPPEKDFESDVLLGRNVQLAVQKEAAPDGKIYSNVMAILPPKVKFAVPANYIRVKDRPPKAGYGSPAAAPAQRAPSDLRANIPPMAPIAQPAAVGAGAEIPDDYIGF